MIPGSGRSPGGGNGTSLQERGAWQATVHGVVKSWIETEHLSISSDRTCVCISLPLDMNLAMWFALANGILARMTQIKT